MMRFFLTLLLLSPLSMGDDMPGGRPVKTNATSSDTATGRNVTATSVSGSKFALDVNIASNSGGGASTVSVSNFPATQPVSGPLTDTQLRATPVPISGTVSLSGGGDATAANQTTGNSSLSSIDTKTPALGQALAAASSPVVLTAAQLTTLTPLTSVAVTNTGTFAVTQGTAANLNATVVGTGTFATQAAIADGAAVTLGAKADAKSTATDTTAITAMQVLKQISASVQAPPSQAVTNTGTFVTQSTLAAETTKVIGTVNVSAAQVVGLSTGSNVIGHVIVDTAPTTAVTIATAPVLVAGTALIGKVGIDQTTPGTTNLVAIASTGSNPCVSPGATLVSITGATSTTNATQIIALSGTTKIYICALTVIGVSGTTPAFGLVSGTGSNCASSQTTVVQVFGTTANQSYLFAGPVAVTTAGHALCYKDTGTSPIENYQITYVQQ